MSQFFAGFLTNFHFLRPWLLLLIIFAVPLLFALRRKQDFGGAWGKVCDANLLPALLVKGAGKTYNMLSALVVAAFVIAVVAAAGPAWQRLPVASVIGGANTVFVVDMGLNMAAGDVTPSRLDRAKFKMYDMLAKAKGDQAALVLFDNVAYVASPLSEDLSVIANIIPTLEMNIMPGNGVSALDKGVNEAVQLLENAGQGNGRIIVLSGAGAAETALAQKAVQNAVAKGNVVSVLAIGSEAGAPARNEKGGFYADTTGKTAVFKTDVAGLRNLASLGGGGFAEVTTDESDVDAVLVKPISAEQIFADANVKVDTWKDMGIYLLFLVLPVVLLAFRKGFIAVFLLAFCLPFTANAGWWQDLWFNQNQQAERKLQGKDYAEAAKHFKDDAWKGYAHYKAGEYKDAVQALSGKTDAESLYNLGNAKAFSGDIQGAIDTYEKAIKVNKDHQDAIFNRDYLKKMQEQQEQDQQQKQDQEKQDKDKNKEQQQDQNKDQNQDKNQDQDKEQNAGQDSQQQQDKQDKQDKDKQQDQQKADQSKDSQNQQQEQKPQEGKDKQDKQQGADNKDQQKQPAEPKEQEKQDQQKQKDEQQVGEPKEQKDEKPADEKQTGSAGAEDKQDAEQQPARQQWLNRIEEDKGGLIRARLQKIYRTKNGE